MFDCKSIKSTSRDRLRSGRYKILSFNQFNILKYVNIVNIALQHPLRGICADKHHNRPWSCHYSHIYIWRPSIWNYDTDIEGRIINFNLNFLLLLLCYTTCLLTSKWKKCRINLPGTGGWDWAATWCWSGIGQLQYLQAYLITHST